MISRQRVNVIFTTTTFSARNRDQHVHVSENNTDNKDKHFCTTSYYAKVNYHIDHNDEKHPLK